MDPIGADKEECEDPLKGKVWVIRIRPWRPGTTLGVLASRTIEMVSSDAAFLRLVWLERDTGNLAMDDVVSRAEPIDKVVRTLRYGSIEDEAMGCHLLRMECSLCKDWLSTSGPGARYVAEGEIQPEVLLKIKPGLLCTIQVYQNQRNQRKEG
jgi:hypothetical protein